MALPSVAEMEAYVREAAARNGIDPDVAVRVARSEGLRKGVWQSNQPARYGRETSYGPFQLHLTPEGSDYDPGLGNMMLTSTGLDPSDPGNWRAGVDFALKYARKYGWKAWSGAKKLGYKGKRNFEGIGMKPKSAPAGIDVAAEEEAPTSTDVAEEDIDTTLPETEDYPSEEAPPEDEYPTEEAPSKYAEASKSLMGLGQSMVADAQDQTFDYTPAGENMEVAPNYDSGIPTDYYRQYMTEPQMYVQEGGEVEEEDPNEEEPDNDADDEELQMFLQVGGEVEGFIPDPNQFVDDDEGMDPNELFSQVLGEA